MKTGFVTDSFSSLGGLASVAYGNADFFREVQNQVIRNSPTKTFDTQIPSGVFLDLVGSEQYFLDLILRGVLDASSLNEEFEDYLDVEFGADWLDDFSFEFIPTFKRVVDSSSNYGNTLNEYLNSTLEILFPGSTHIEFLSSTILEKINKDTLLGSDIDLFTKIPANNPLTKISAPPPDTVVTLEESVELDFDYRGVSFSSAYLTPQAYFSEIAYPGFESVSAIPSTFKDSITQGYVGYPRGLPLESVFNPGAESIRDLAISPTSVLSGSDIWESSSILGVLGDVPGLAQGDRDIYEISLMGPRINGLLTYDPDKSNGDNFDISNLPKILNSDKEDGVIASSRRFSKAF